MLAPAVNPLPATWSARRIRGAGDRKHSRRIPTGEGFSLIEVMIASIVMVLAITTAITTLQSGF